MPKLEISGVHDAYARRLSRGHDPLGLARALPFLTGRFMRKE